jgi:hypothetical protein
MNPIPTGTGSATITAGPPSPEGGDAEGVRPSAEGTLNLEVPMAWHREATDVESGHAVPSSLPT